MATNSPTGYRARDRRLTRRRLLGSCGAAAAGAVAFACRGRQEPAGQGRQPGVPASGGQAMAETPQTGGTFNYYLIGNPPTLDPFRTTSNLAHRLAGAVNDRLFRFKSGHDPRVTESKELEHGLAVSVESPDALQWIVKLRPDATFHAIPPVNGHAVEAEDIKATFVRALDKQNPNGATLDMITANGIETPSRDTVVFKLTYPFGAFPTVLGLINAWVFPREAGVSYDPAKVMIGSGPFILESFTPDVAVVLKRNPEWFQKEGPYIDAVRLAILPEPAQQIAQFQAGNLDQLETAANDVDTVKRSTPKADLIVASPASMNPLVGNLSDPASVWHDIRVRRALSMMMNRDAIAASVLGGKAQPQAMLPASLGKWAVKGEDLDPAVAQWYKYDPGAAKRLLAEAGAANLSVKLIYTPNGYAQPYGTLAETLSSMLNAAGVKSTLVPVDYNSQYVAGGRGIRAGNFDADGLVLGAMSGGYTVIDEIMFRFFHSKSSARFTALADPEYDALVDKARSQVREEDRLKTYHDAQKRFIDKAWYLTGWPWQPAYTFVQPWVRNFQYSNTYAFITESYTKLWLKKA